MFELTQTLWAVALVVFPVGLFIGVGLMVWRAGGLPVPETMQLLDTMVMEHERTRDRVTALEQRVEALDGVSVLRKGR
ncbi:MAG: hypothetical protein EBT13_07205 [Rhodobacteraceae bacterium]|nr:hypothetical protein [Paracoccaceae bacterium]